MPDDDMRDDDAQDSDRPGRSSKKRGDGALGAGPSRRRDERARHSDYEPPSAEFSWEFDAERQGRDRHGRESQRIYGAQRPRRASPGAQGERAPGAGPEDRPPRGSGATAGYGSTQMPNGPNVNGPSVKGPSVEIVQRRQDAALDRWWIAGELPPQDLLRDGLRVLTQAQSMTGLPLLTEAQQTLLLRGALHHRRGMLTALRYHMDDERVVLVLTEAVVSDEPPFLPWEVVDLLQRLDEAGETVRMRSWLVGLEYELAHAVVNEQGRRKYRARMALEALRGFDPTTAPDYAGDAAAMFQAEDAAPRRHRWIRQLILLALLLALIGLLIWQRVQWTPPDMVRIPPATYALPAALGAGDLTDDGPAPVATAPATNPVQLDGYLIDRYEVTNRDYRRCVAAGACRAPRVQHSRTRPNYFVNRAFDPFPVVHVTWENARNYCAWRNRRLPTAAEWQVAASYAPSIQALYTYPWGQEFAVQVANSAGAGVGDTVAGGVYRPGGDSPTGVVDMAGNVAEWTASPASPENGVDSAGEAADEEAQGAPAMIVKGGSFQSGIYELMARSEVAVLATETRDWLGFRCVRAHLSGLE